MELLDNKTHNAVKRLARNKCAKYINGGCVLTDSPCDYFSPYGKAISCDWFEQSVLPNDPLLEQDYKTAHGINYTETGTAVHVGKCVKCGDEYVKASNRQAYCKPCSTVKQREHARKYYRKQS